MADKSDIIDAIEALAVHCRPPLMTIELREIWLRDWCEDLAKFPADAIRQACRNYRQSGQTKFPTAGHLMPLIRAAMPNEDAGERLDEWRPLDDAEYAGLSIREKIRHQLILAHDAGCKAGPMWRNPEGASMARPVDGRIPLADMPDTYRRWVEIQRQHLAEAGRLREILRRPQTALAHGA